MKSDSKNITLAILYFALSALFTWWFVNASSLYSSMRQEVLSTGIAGAKWAIQIAAAFIFLADKKWIFIKYIGFTCLTGSIILLPYPVLVLVDYFDTRNAGPYFVGSLLIAVAVMIVLYFLSVKKSGIAIKWFWSWIICLSIAITLQLTVVFSVIKF